MNFLNIYLGFEVIIVQGYAASLVFQEVQFSEIVSEQKGIIEEFAEYQDRTGDLRIMRPTL